MTFPDSLDHRVGHAGEGGRGIRQHPEAGIHHADGFRAGGALQPRGKFLRKSAGDRRGFRARRVPQIQSADGADLRGRGQPAQKTVSLQQYHPRAGAPGRGRRRHARRTAADDQHVAGNGRGTDAKGVAHGVRRLMCSP